MDNFKRYFFVIFNILYLVVGITVLVFSLWLQFGSPIHEIALDIQASQFVIYIGFAVGGLLTFVGGVGVFGTFYANKCLLYVYVLIISCFIIAEVGVSVYAVVVKMLGDGMVVTINVWDKFDQSIRDTMQERFECCGFQNITAETNSTDDIPCTCFVNQTSCELGLDPTDGDYFEIGCYDKIMEWIENNIYTLIIVASLVLFIELCQVVVASLLIQAVGRRRTHPSSRRSHHHRHSDRYHSDHRRQYDDDYEIRRQRSRHQTYSNSAYER